MTDAELLTKLNTAIDGLLDNPASSYSIAGRSVTYQNLDELMTWRDKLQGRVDRAASGGMFRTAKMQRPSR